MREISDKFGDRETLLIMDLLEVDEGNSLLPLATTIQISAGLAAADGLTEKMATAVVQQAR